MNFKTVEGPDGKLAVLTICVMCKAKIKLIVQKRAYVDWQRGANIQNVMPELPAGDRELLISGTCNKCWEELFPPEEEEEP